jgi:hypothetical protein
LDRFDRGREISLEQSPRDRKTHATQPDKPDVGHRRPPLGEVSPGVGTILGEIVTVLLRE